MVLASGSGLRGQLRPGQAGFSLVEVLLASVILLIMLLGLVPVFLQSMGSNLEGKESSDVSIFARSRAEELFALDFNSEPLRLSDGTERQYFEVYRDGDWEAVVSLGTLPTGTEWTRTATIRQFNIATLDDPLAFDADPGQVHLKEIVVSVRRVGGRNFSNRGQRLAVRLFKSQ